MVNWRNSLLWIHTTGFCSWCIWCIWGLVRHLDILMFQSFSKKNISCIWCFSHFENCMIWKWDVLDVSVIFKIDMKLRCFSHFQNWYEKYDMIKFIWKQNNCYVVFVTRFKKFAWKLPKLKVAKVENCQNWKMPNLKIDKVVNWQNWKLLSC